MKPFFSVITPTILRLSLENCIASVNEQTFDAREQIVMVDGDTEEAGIKVQLSDHFQWRFTGRRHKDFGNAARHKAWEFANGVYCYFLDDDNQLADSDALQRVSTALASADFPQVAFFPILLEGKEFFPPDPPCIAEVDTANLVVRTEFGRWPIGPDYDMDGKFIESLAREHKCAYFPDVEPIAIVERANHGQ